MLIAAAGTTSAAQASPPSPRAVAADAATPATQSAQQLVTSRAAELHVSASDAFTQRPVISTRDGLQYLGTTGPTRDCSSSASP
ncbi:MAG TPA: hypothetical protein VIS06_01925 [Mycobacteriales bacterium]